MSEPKIAGTVPIVKELEAGTHYWCACGHSAGQPFCDGSHKGTGMVPMAFEMKAAGKVALCACKRTGNAPFCDGTHHKL
jgi:CDGSH iron-sulfur domain-containing protein 3